MFIQQNILQNILMKNKAMNKVKLIQITSFEKLAFIISDQLSYSSHMKVKDLLSTPQLVH